jgi:long-chain acyl-CoA synthetase
MIKELNTSSPFAAFSQNVAAHPDKTALVFLGSQWKFSEIKELSERLAGWFHRQGIKAGDKAIIYLPNIPQTIIAWLALQRLNAIPVVISPIYTTHELKYMANDTGAETLFCMDTNFNYVTRVLPDTKIKRVIVASTVGMLPWWKRTMGRAFDRIPEGKYKLSKSVFSFESLLSESPAGLPPLVDESQPRTMLILYTGGTMGLPKGVPINNLNFLRISLDMRKVIEPLIPAGDGILLQAAPLFHVLGQNSGFGTCLCIAGETMILAPRVNLDAHFDIIQRLKVNMEYGVPALYRMILTHDRLDQYNLSSLKYCLVGGDAVPVDLVESWRRKFGRPLYQAFGVTEGSGTVLMTPPDLDFPSGALGKAGTIPTQELRLMDAETLKEVPLGEPGELFLHSEHMVKAYWNKPEESAENFIDVDGKLWYRTKDVLRLDDKGWYYFLDRSADMIKHKGYRVAASEVERILQEHPAVIAACVVGIPDKSVGERIKAFAVLKQDVKGVTSYDLQAFCRSRLAAYKVPSYIEFRDMLPKSKVGKLLRRELRAEERKKMEK